MAGSKLLVQTIQDATVVNFRDSAILDSSVVEAVGRDLYALIDEKAVRKLVLDFGSVQFLASQAIGVLIALKKKADAIGGQVAICAMRDEIRKVFKIMSLQKLFKFYPNETEALAALGVFTA